MSGSGLITVASDNPAARTLELLQSAIRSAGNAVFAVFDHAEAASGVGLSLRPTTVVAFGNPAAGTKLMQLHQQIGLDLPLKILVWEDESGKAKLSYNDPKWLADRHGLGAEGQGVIAAMTKLLDSLTKKAASAGA